MQNQTPPREYQYCNQAASTAPKEGRTVAKPPQALVAVAKPPPPPGGYVPGQPMVVAQPASAKMQAARQDQYRIYQLQQEQKKQQFLTQQSQHPRVQHNADAAYCGAYMHSSNQWNRTCSYCNGRNGYHAGYCQNSGYYYYGYHDHYYYHDHQYYDDHDDWHGEDDYGWTEEDLDVDHDEWESYNDMGADYAPEAGGEEVAEAGADVDMYAGGEDQRPGGGPPPESSSAVLSGLITTAPRLDLAAWFETRIQGAEKKARQAVIGREGNLPLSTQVLLRSAFPSSAANSGICLVTQCSLDRLPRLAQQLEAWEGEVSCAVFVDAREESLDAAKARRSIVETCCHAAATLAARNPEAPSPVWTITVVYRLKDEDVVCAAYDQLYPVNALRNVAMAGARSGCVFLLDVDFVPSNGLYQRLCGGDKAQNLLKTLRSHNHGLYSTEVALVVPAFEAKWKAQIPMSESALVDSYIAGDVEGFHITQFPKGHRATDFRRWFAGESSSGKRGAAEGSGFLLSEHRHGADAYLVDYEEHYEPYVVMARDCVAQYDERFRGYGLNKISHLYEVAKRGISFYVLDHRDAFVVADRHPRSESWRLMYGPDAEALHRARLATHFANFKVEVDSRAARATQGRSSIFEETSGVSKDAIIDDTTCIFLSPTTAALLSETLSNRCRQLAQLAVAA